MYVAKRKGEFSLGSVNELKKEKNQYNEMMEGEDFGLSSRRGGEINENPEVSRGGGKKGSMGPGSNIPREGNRSNHWRKIQRKYEKDKLEDLLRENYCTGGVVVWYHRKELAASHVVWFRD